MKIHPFQFLFLLLIFCPFSFNLKAQTTIEKTENGWTLLVKGKPFAVKGVTFGYDKNVENYESYFQDLQFLGVNTIRLWATNENTKQLLDVAHAHGIRVMIGIWMRHGRPGMEDDDSFNYLEDNQGMEKMYLNAIQTVEKYKDHPAVLMWGVGNEVYLNMSTDAEKKAYSLLLEKIASQIKQLDSNHPIASVEAWTFGIDWWQKWVPSIDIYGINCYGSGANFLPEELAKKGVKKPYVITEFGVTGEWDIQEEKNGIKIEPTDHQKYEAITNGYQNWIKNQATCLGVYVFHYGNGNDFASPWLLTHHRKMYRPQYWAIREAYTGNKPTNNVPRIENFVLPDSKLNSGMWVPVSLSISDTENEEIEVDFFYNQRTGSRKRRNQINPLLYRGNLQEGFEIQLPNEDGAIKVYVNAKDTFNNVGVASTSIVVIDKKAREKKYLAAKTNLPFYVYQEGFDMPYVPSGYMGNIDHIEVDLHSQSDVHAGKYGLKIAYTASDNWYGVGFVDPANDWGDILGGYDISGAKTFSFWAKANDTNVKATIGFGLIDKDKPFPDTAKKSKEIVLTTEWKQYSINIKKLDLTCIRSGLVIFSSSNGFPHEIYLDDVVFE
ncbi:MAG: glycoside hydrolase family 2 TIM barrel-domain containing protein [Chitinophagales bacterium]